MAKNQIYCIFLPTKAHWSDSFFIGIQTHGERYMTDTVSVSPLMELTEKSWPWVWFGQYWTGYTDSTPPKQRNILETTQSGFPNVIFWTNLGGKNFKHPNIFELVWKIRDRLSVLFAGTWYLLGGTPRTRPAPPRRCQVPVFGQKKGRYLGTPTGFATYFLKF
jgi:hypothetical protein